MYMHLPSQRSGCRASIHAFIHSASADALESEDCAAVAPAVITPQPGQQLRQQHKPQP